jgi:hypothetical protein
MAKPTNRHEENATSMPEAGRAKAAPWITAAVTAAVMVAAMVTYFVVRGGNDSSAKQTAFTSDEKTAITAAGTETANLLSFRRAKFEADFKRALDGATGAIKSDIQGKKAATLKTMNDGKFDLAADVLHTALVGPVNDSKVTGYVVLVSLNGYRSTQKNLPTQQNLQVTIVKQSGKWLVNDVKMIGVS